MGPTLTIIGIQGQLNAKCHNPSCLFYDFFCLL